MFQLFVEGRGENAAAQKLVYKIIHHFGLGNDHFTEGRRLPNLDTKEGVQKAIQLARLDPKTEGVLIIRDCDDDCPKQIAPKIASDIQAENLPFPVGYCLMYREFESLFIAHAPEWAGKGIAHNVRGTLNFKDNIPIENPENIRGAKEAITKYLAGNRVYKPTLDQITLTQALDINVMIGKQLPCFETLVRCIHYILSNKGQSVVYPVPN